MDNKALIITPKPLKGEDGYRTFSIRIKEDLVMQLDVISQNTGRSRNELIARFIEYAIENCVIGDVPDKK